MKLADCARSLLRNWWLVLGVGIAASLIAYFVASGEPDVYQSRGRVVLGISKDLAAPQNGQVLNNVSDRSLIATFAEVAGSRTVRDAALAAVGVDPVSSDYSLSSARLPEANGVEVKVTGPDPEVVRALASAAVIDGTQKFIDLYPGYATTVVEEPQTPTSPISPKPKVMAVVAAMLGVILGFLLGLGLDRWRLARATATSRRRARA